MVQAGFAASAVHPVHVLSRSSWCCELPRGEWWGHEGVKVVAQCVQMHTRAMRGSQGVVVRHWDALWRAHVRVMGGAR